MCGDRTTRPISPSANNKSNMPHSTRRTYTLSPINVRNDVRILYIEHSSAWRYVEKTLCAFSAGGLKKGRSANSQMEETLMVNVQVNGQERTFGGDPSMPLLWYLRDELGLTGTKFGCGVSLCGACTVHINGEAVRACTTPMSDVAGKKVVTIEGLDANGRHPVQVAWRNIGVPQCGYCQTGQIMNAAALLAKTPAPTDAEIDAAMAGNLCRCGCYQRIHAAVRAASKGA
jgi:isoquinoline 1-oxidoreductase subunit alpha